MIGISHRVTHSSRYIKASTVKNIFRLGNFKITRFLIKYKRWIITVVYRVNMRVLTLNFCVTGAS